MTLAFLENQLASALTLQSPQEYRYWLLIYARFLVNEGERRPPAPRWSRDLRAHLSASFSPPALQVRSIVCANFAKSCWVPSTSRRLLRGSRSHW